MLVLRVGSLLGIREGLAGGWLPLELEVRSPSWDSSQKYPPGKLPGHRIQGTVPSLGKSKSFLIYNLGLNTFLYSGGWGEDSRRLGVGDSSACLLKIDPV